MTRDYEIDPVTFITIGTIGPPGERVFHLQAGDEHEHITLVIEKTQAAALVATINQLMEELSDKLNLPPADARAGQMDMDLHEPILPVFRVAQIGLGFDQQRELVLMVAQELQPEDTIEEPAAARFFATRDQMAALSIWAVDIVNQGRPICVHCDKPIDPDGHFCPERNGHGAKFSWV